MLFLFYFITRLIVFFVKLVSYLERILFFFCQWCLFSESAGWIASLHTKVWVHIVSKSLEASSNLLLFFSCYAIFWPVEQRLNRKAYCLKELNKSRESLVPVALQTWRGTCFCTIFFCISTSYIHSRYVSREQASSVLLRQLKKIMG